MVFLKILMTWQWERRHSKNQSWMEINTSSTTEMAKIFVINYIALIWFANKNTLMNKREKILKTHFLTTFGVFLDTIIWIKSFFTSVSETMVMLKPSSSIKYLISMSLISYKHSNGKELMMKQFKYCPNLRKFFILSKSMNRATLPFTKAKNWACI